MRVAALLQYKDSWFVFTKSVLFFSLLSPFPPHSFSLSRCLSAIFSGYFFFRKMHTQLLPAVAFLVFNSFVDKEIEEKVTLFNRLRDLFANGRGGAAASSSSANSSSPFHPRGKGKPEADAGAEGSAGLGRGISRADSTVSVSSAHPLLVPGPDGRGVLLQRMSRPVSMSTAQKMSSQFLFPHLSTTSPLAQLMKISQRLSSAPMALTDNGISPFHLITPSPAHGRHRRRTVAPKQAGSASDAPSSAEAPATLAAAALAGSALSASEAAESGGRSLHAKRKSGQSKHAKNKKKKSQGHSPSPSQAPPGGTGGQESGQGQPASFPLPRSTPDKLFTQSGKRPAGAPAFDREVKHSLLVQKEIDDDDEYEYEYVTELPSASFETDTQRTKRPG